MSGESRASTSSGAGAKGVSNASPLAQVLRLASYAILTSFLQTFVFVVDRALLGHHSGAALGQMQISGTVEWSAFAIFSGFFAATFARVGRHTGADDRARAVIATRLSVGFGLVFGLVLTLLTPVLLALLPRLAPAASPEIIKGSRDYLGVTLFASPLVFVGTAGVSALQAGGDTRTPLFIGVVTNSVHIALNWVLVLGYGFVPALGSRGAAWGTAVTFFLETVLVLFALSRVGGPDRGSRSAAKVSLRFPPGTERPSRDTWRKEARELFSVGGPAMLEKVVYQTGFLSFVAMITMLGDRVMEANQSLIGIESICFLSADGFAIATAALVAQKIGAKEEQMVTTVTRSAMFASVVWLTALGVFFFLVRAPLVGLFSNDRDTVSEGMRTMWVLALAQPFMATAQVLAAALRGGGRTKTVFGVSTLGAIVVRLSCTYVLAFPLRMGLPGVWLGSTADWFVRTIVLFFLVFRVRVIGRGAPLVQPGSATTPS